jgi:lipoprotein-anchoring transpeptidase ErfK/SrfK
MHSFILTVVRAMAWFGMMLAPPAWAQDLSLDTINRAEFSKPLGPKTSPSVIKLEVMLDRLHFSPGVIDGHDGDNLRKALAAFAQTHGLDPNQPFGPSLWSKLTEASPEPVVTRYTISKADLKGPFSRRIPSDLEQQSKLKRLSYRNSVEELAERFHMDQSLLRTLNPHQRLDRAGTSLIVANVQPAPAVNRMKAVKVEVDKAAHQVRVLAEDGSPLVFYPASIGSDEKPAPSGTLTVLRVVHGPNYTYDPAYGFKGVKAHKKFTIQPGPNNPVGSVWIDLSLESYGIHGTPDPERVGKAYSHGCIRLTNWDAEELATMVQKGTPVLFLN